MTRWFVQIDARFASVWPPAVEEAVAERLDRAGLLAYGDRDNSVLGDPGPILCATLVIEAAGADAAAAAGWRAYSEALDAAGAEGYRRGRTVAKPMADVERESEELRAWAAQRSASLLPGDGLHDWLELREDVRPTDPA